MEVQYLRRAEIHKYFMLLLLGMAISAFLRLPYFQYHFIFVDEAWWANGAKVLHEGGRLYVDVELDKNPPIFWFCAALFRIFGVSMAAIHWGLLFLIWTVSALLYRLGARFFSRGAGAAAALVYPLASTTYYIPRIIGMNTETLMAVFSTAAVLCYLHALLGGSRPGCFFALAGFLSSWAFLTKPVAITETAMLAAFLLLGRDRDRSSKFRSLAALLAGLILALASFVGYLAATGILLPWWEQAVLFGFRYVGHISPEAFLIKSLRSTAAFGIIFAWLFMLIWLSRKMRAENRRAYAFVLLWSLSAFAGVVLGRRYYANYFLQMMPPLSLLGGVGLAHLWKTRRQESGRRIRRVCCAAFVASFLWFHSRTLANWISFAFPQIHQIRLWNMGAENRRSLEIAEYLKRKTTKQDSIFIWGSNPELYFLSARTMATAWLMFDVADDYPPRAGEPEVQAHAAELLLKKRPRYIIDVQQVAHIEGFPHFRDLVANHYELEKEIDGVRLFRLR